jgi:glycosyltransferase involved in cell wall biosynthesis
MVAQALARDGLDVGLLVRGEKLDLPSEVGGVHVVTQRTAPRLRGVGGLLHDLYTLWALLRTPARVIVQRSAGRTAAVAVLAARLRGARFVYSSANVVDFQMERLERPSNVRLFEWGFRAADRVVVQTQEQARMCREHFNRDPVVIGSIAEPVEPRDGTPDAFLWIARLVWYKRLDVYLDLARDVPEALFQVVAVRGPHTEPEMAALLERAAQEPNVQVLEPRSRADLVPLIERAVAIVNTADYEGMPNVFLEGWSRGVPALAFSHDPDGVVVKHGLGEFAGGSRERLAELARAQWGSREDQRVVAQRCIDYVRRHHHVDTVTSAWRDVLGTLGVG